MYVSWGNNSVGWQWYDMTMVLIDSGIEWQWYGMTVIGSDYPDSKFHGANMGPTWGRQDPGGPHVGHMNLTI